MNIFQKLLNLSSKKDANDHKIGIFFTLDCTFFLLAPPFLSLMFYHFTSIFSSKLPVLFGSIPFLLFIGFLPILMFNDKYADNFRRLLSRKKLRNIETELDKEIHDYLHEGDNISFIMKEIYSLYHATDNITQKKLDQFIEQFKYFHLKNEDSNALRALSNIFKTYCHYQDQINFTKNVDEQFSKQLNPNILISDKEIEKEIGGDEKTSFGKLL